jgi:predicted  nucleic acid-binding Zn-ribbon protein
MSNRERINRADDQLIDMRIAVSALLERSTRCQCKFAASQLNFETVKDMSNEERINRMEDQLIDMRLAVSALLDTVTLHQRNFDTTQRNIETMQREILNLAVNMVEIKSEIRGLQTENRRILDILQNRNTEGDSEA